MNNINIQPIRTYQDLVREEQRLAALLQWHRSQINADVEAVKKQISPLVRVVSFIAQPIALVRKSSLPGMGLGVGAGMLLLNIARKTAGNWLQRLMHKKRAG
jgi:hypothetical protein